MEHWKEIIKLVYNWQHTKRIAGTSMKEDEDLFIKELNEEFVLVKRDEIVKNEIVFKPGIDPPTGII
jgi:hypothetical protein